MIKGIDQYPEYIRNAFYDARSEEHFYDIEKQVQERLKTEEEIAKLGWKGFGARMIAAVADPAAIAGSLPEGAHVT